jgi:hypothetical protein
LFCSFCGRLLYWEGEPVSEAPVTAGARQRPEDEEGESV